MKKVLVTFIMLLFAGTTPALAGNVEIIDKDGLKAILDSPDLVLLDVRTGKDWSSSEFKIKGAIRLKSDAIASAPDTYGKDKTIVLYCA